MVVSGAKALAHRLDTDALSLRGACVSKSELEEAVAERALSWLTEEGDGGISFPPRLREVLAYLSAPTFPPGMSPRFYPVTAKNLPPVVAALLQLQLPSLKLRRPQQLGFWMAVIISLAL